VAKSTRYRFDDIRRVGAELLAGVGVAPERASALISSLLWYDAADARPFGIVSLPDWLDAIDRGEADPIAVGSIQLEFNGTAVLDGQQAPAPLVFLRAARIAQEKAREVGVGIVRVTNPGGVAPVAAVVADIGIGPMVGFCHGPGPSWTVAVPTMGEMPAVFSTELGGESTGPSWSIAGFPAWSSPFAADGSWLFAAYSVKAFEPLAVFHERIDAQLGSRSRVAGEVRPGDWQAARTAQLAEGLCFLDGSDDLLRSLAERSGLVWPDPLPD
jgi:LDH2 family malate/lactate/ureidoglycolate dehydrogenase